MQPETNVYKLFFNGPIITMNEKEPHIEALGILDEKIISTGKLNTVKEMLGQDYISVDFELKEVLKEAVESKSKDQLIVALNLSEEKFDDPVLPTRWDLDDACPEHPIFVLRYDGHIGIANTKALDIAGIDKSTPVPEGGEIRKNENGELTGILTETAVSPILNKVSFPKGEELKNATIKAFNYLASQGLTSLHGILHSDAGGEFGDFGVVEIPLLKSIQSDILHNWYLMVNTERPKKLLRLKKPPLDGGKPDSQFRLGCAKFFLDGTFIHAIGDKGNRIVVNLYKRLLDESPREDHRHRIEHASILTEDVLKDMAKYKIIASCQPPFINSEFNWLEKRLGKERLKDTYPMKSILDAGVTLISGSDCPVEDPNVIMGLHALVHRNDFIPEQRISIEEALKTYTINAAYGAFEENIKGSIEIGKLADFVIVNRNPLEVPNDEIRNIQVMETIIRGKTVYKINQ